MSSKKDDNLFQLIQSLTKSEKIYFRKQTSAFAGKESSYIALFDALNAQKEYDETALRRQFADQKQLGVLKNYLYESLLDSLVQFRAKEDAEIQLQQAKQTVRVLMEKKMPEAALKRLQKAIQKAKEGEHYLLVINLLSIHQKLIANLQTHDLVVYENNWSEIDAYLEKFANMQTYLRIQVRSAHWLRRDRQGRNAETRRELAEILSHPLLQSPEQALSFRARLLFYSIQDTHHKAHGNFALAAQASAQAIQLYESAPALKKQDLQNYLGVFINYLNALYYHKDFAGLLEGLKRLKTLKFNDFKLQNLCFTRYAVFFFSYMKLTDDFREFDALCREVASFLDEHDKELPVHEKRLIFYNIVHNSIRTGDYLRAFDWRLRLGQLPKTKIQSDFQRFERLFEILIHYALQNYELVLSLCQSVARHLQQEPENRYESLFVRQFQRLAKLPILGYKTGVADCLQEWNALFEAYPEERKALEYFDVVWWLEKQMHGIAY